jgi:D-glycero-alpha-D-manno-heptose-7-phosphate kinase
MAFPVRPPPRAIRARAPLRLGFAGGGTDVSPYCDRHGGLVVNAALALYAYAHIEPRDDGLVEIIAADMDERVSFSAAERLPTDHGARLACGVYNRMIAEFGVGAPFPATITTWVDVPAGSGLGSSSTLVVALVEAFREALQAPIGEYDVAKIAFEVERRDLGLSGGRQDQYAAAFGGFNVMEFYADERVVVNPLRLPARTALELEASIILCYTGASRSSAAIIDRQVAGMEADAGDALAAMHAVKTEASDMKEALLLGDMTRAAETLNRGWAAKRRTAQGVSSPEIDAMIDGAFAAGARAGKISGAGGGGFAMFLADAARRPAIERHLSALGGRILPCRFEPMGAQAWRAF